MSNIDKYETRKKMVYDFMCDDMYVPMKIKELCIVLGVKKEDRPQLEQILLDLQAEGRITLSKRGKYSKSEIKKTVGVFTAHQRGFGFVTVEGEPDDIFIPAEYVMVRCTWTLLRLQSPLSQQAAARRERLFPS